MICCGDGYNDLTMIETAGLGVAMENAQPLVREKADFITKSNDDEGVLFVIDQFCAIDRRRNIISQNIKIPENWFYFQSPGFLFSVFFCT